jgi:RimJ/RimL family protein N-acetyltransferase
VVSRGAGAFRERPDLMARRLPHLSDAVVVLRPWKLDDARALVAAGREPDISFWLGLSLPTTYGQGMAWIGDAATAWSDGRDAHLAIDDAATGEVVGAVSLQGVDPVESHGRFSYWVRAARRHRGTARRALSLLAAWARDDLGLERLEVVVAVGNIGGQRVAEAAGFVREAVYRSYRQVGESRTDYILFALPMPSWNIGLDWVDGIDQSEVEPEGERPPTAEVLLPAEPPVIEGGGLRLRPYRADDLEPLVAAIDAETVRWLNHVPWPYTTEAGRGFLGFAAGSWLAHQAHFAIADAASDALLGGLNVDIDLPHAIGEVGYRVNPEARGRGVASGAVGLAADWGLGELRLSRLDLGADARNAASLRVAVKSGFRREGTLHGLVRRGRERSDDAIYSLLPTDPRPR